MDCASEWIQQFQHNDDPFCDDPKFQCIIKTGVKKGEDGKRGSGVTNDFEKQRI